MEMPRKENLLTAVLIAVLGYPVAPSAVTAYGGHYPPKKLPIGNPKPKSEKVERLSRLFLRHLSQEARKALVRNPSSTQGFVLATQFTDDPHSSEIPKNAVRIWRTETAGGERITAGYDLPLFWDDTTPFLSEPSISLPQWDGPRIRFAYHDPENTFGDEEINEALRIAVADKSFSSLNRVILGAKEQSHRNSPLWHLVPESRLFWAFWETLNGTQPEKKAEGTPTLDDLFSVQDPIFSFAEGTLRFSATHGLFRISIEFEPALLLKYGFLTSAASKPGQRDEIHYLLDLHEAYLDPGPETAKEEFSRKTFNREEMVSLFRKVQRLISKSMKARAPVRDLDPQAIERILKKVEEETKKLK